MDLCCIEDVCETPKYSQSLNSSVEITVLRLRENIWTVDIDLES